MKHLKRMIGIVAGLFSALVVAGLNSVLFNLDASWYARLTMPPFVLDGGAFEVMVAITYASSVLSISRLVEFKHLFPSLLFFLTMGIGSVLFCLCFFTLESLTGALLSMTLTAAMAYLLFFRFLIKDVKIAVLFFPTFLFNCYAYACTLSIFLMN